MTGEATYAGSYAQSTSWVSLAVEHVYFLLPLVLDAAFNVEDSFLAMFVKRNRTVFVRLDSTTDKENRQEIVKFVKSQPLSKTSTTHFWYSDITGKAKEAFDQLSGSSAVFDAFRKEFNSKMWCVEEVHGMNEVYIACEHHKTNSDTVFYMTHIDGPFPLVPFCSVYRCMLACNKNTQIETHFPATDKKFALSDGYMIGFDFNRELHYIANSDKRNDDFRVNLKLHYAVYPYALKPLGVFLKNATTA